MADTNIPNQDDLRELNEAGMSFVDIIRQMNAELNRVKRTLADNVDEQANITRETKATTDLANALAGFGAEQFRNSRSRVKFEKQLTDAKREQQRLEHKIRTTSGRAQRIYRDQLQTNREITKEAQHLLKAFQEIDGKVKFFEDMSELVQEVPILRKLFPEFKKAAEEARKAVSETGKTVDGVKEASKQLLGALEKGLAVLGVGLAVKGVQKVDKEVTQLSRDLNFTEFQARATYNQLRNIEGFTVEQSIKSLNELNSALGTAGTLSTNTLTQLNILTSRLGISSQEASTLFSLAASTNREFDSFTDTLVGAVQIQNALNNSALDYKDILSDINTAGAGVRLSLSQNPKALSDAAFQARKLGLTLNSVDNIAQGLLNFESSIAVELEAELLTGKQLNLERARMYALTNDIEGLTREIAKQNITAAKFARMNRLQQQAIAGSLGMSRDEMAQMFERQSAIEAINRSNLDTNSKLNQLLKSGVSYSEAARILGKDEISLRQEIMSLEEKRQVAMDRLATAAIAFLDALKPLKSMFDGIASVASTILKTLLIIAGLRFAGIRNLSGAFGSAAKGAKSLASSAGSVSAAATTAAGGAAATGGAATASRGLFGSMFSKGSRNIVKDSRLPSGYRNATTGRAVSAAEGASATGGIFSKISKNGFKTALKGAKGLGIISSILEGFFAKSDIEMMIASATSKDQLRQDVGKRALQGIAGVGVGILGGALGSLFGPGLVTALGYMGGDFIGRWFAGKLADWVGARPIGDAALSMFPNAKATRPDLFGGTANIKTKELELATGGIVTKETRATIGEAGAEAVVPLNEFYGKMDEMIQAVREGKIINMNGYKVGETLALSSVK